MIEWLGFATFLTLFCIFHPNPKFGGWGHRIGIRKEDLPKHEEELELNVAKAQLEELKKDALEAMETQKKREEFKDEEAVETKNLDIRNFL